MVAKTLLNDVLSLPAADRRELVEHLWESLQGDPNAFTLTEEQGKELDRRAAEMERDPTLGSSWEDVKARVCRKP